MAKLDIHPASDAERLAAYRNVHDVWSGGLPLDEHVQRRLASVQHNRARWYVGCVDGRVATSLAVYPLRFVLHGRSLEGFSIGSVHTLSDYRGCGYAPQLIGWVEAFETRQGARLSMLYSDIQPEYYARLGYLRCPAWQGWAESHDAASSPSKGYRLAPCDAAMELEQVMDFYKRYHAAAALCIERPRHYWEFLLQKWPEDEFHWLCDPAGERQGYMRLTRRDGETRIADYALAQRDASLLQSLYASVLAVERNRSQRIGGWVPDCAVARDCFAVTQRSKEITMVKPLSEETSLDEAAIQAADYFCEIDHV